MKFTSKISAMLQALLIAWAVSLKQDFSLFGTPETGIKGIYIGLTNLLGVYRLDKLLIFVLALVFVAWMQQKEIRISRKEIPLPCFFAGCLLVGKSYTAAGNLFFCFGGVFQTLSFVLGLAGYTILFYYLIAFFREIYRKAAAAQWSPDWVKIFLDDHSFRNVFWLLILVWTPIIILSYPGTLCWDSLEQIMQGYGWYGGYSSHHPLLHTMILRSMVKLGELVAGNRDAGLFLYIWMQAFALSAALAGTAARLARRHVSYVLRLMMIGVYVFAPMYSNMVSTVIKDIPYAAAVIWYILLLEELVTEGAAGKKMFYWIRLLLVQMLVGLLRNNGIYMVVLTGLIMALLYLKKAGVKRAAFLLLCLAVLPFAGYKAGNEAMIHALSAQRGSIAEMFSIPFQQTARYLQSYRGDLTAEEEEAIEGVLGDVDTVAAAYNPNISDPVKLLYRKDAGVTELLLYFKVWFRDFFKHPALYVDAFMVHVYGWFDPGVSNVTRHSVTATVFGQGVLFPGAEKLLQYYYCWLEYIPFLAVLENVGIYTWLLLILLRDVIKTRCRKGILLIPLAVSLLICMASPCFYGGSRYAYPIMFTLPFLYGVMSGEMKEA